MSKLTKTVISLLCILAMLVPACVFGADSENPPSGGPGGESGGSTDDPSSGGKEEEVDDPTTTFTYVTFGSYPQTEVVSQASDSGVDGKTWSADSDYIIDAELYSTLQGLSDDAWDENGDTTVDGNKYRRIKKSDATTSKSSTDENIAYYYSWASSDTYHYFKYEPITWRVLEQNGNNYFLLSEISLDAQMFNSEINGTVTWENSSSRSWLNGEFMNTAFTSEEQSKIVITTNSNKVNIDEETGVVAGDNTNEKIFLLSDDEVCVTDYGFSSKSNTSNSARKSLSSTYAKAMGVETNDAGNCYWWLRSPGSHPGLNIMVRQTGSIYVGGQHCNSKSRGIRPAMHVVLSDDTSDTKAGDFNNDGTVSVSDLVCLRNYLASYDYDEKSSSSAINSSADMNDDDAINLKDLVALRLALVS